VFEAILLQSVILILTSKKENEAKKLTPVVTMDATKTPILPQSNCPADRSFTFFLLLYHFYDKGSVRTCGNIGVISPLNHPAQAVDIHSIT
jgi:hypothetical protein